LLSLIDKDWRRVVEPGRFEVAVGGRQPGPDAAGVLSAVFELQGQPVALD
jgi:hypothetical protein